MRVVETVTFTEYIEGNKVYGPDQLREIAADERDCAQQYFFPRQTRPPDGGREATEHKQPESDITHSNQTEGQIPTQFVLKLTRCRAGPIEMLIDDNESR